MLKLYLDGVPVSLARNSATEEKREQAKIPSPNPLPFCPPEQLDFKIRNSDFRQKKLEFQPKGTAKLSLYFGTLSVPPINFI